MSMHIEITLQTIRYIKQSEDAGSEPYIWPFLAREPRAPAGFQNTASRVKPWTPCNWTSLARARVTSGCPQRGAALRHRRVLGVILIAAAITPIAGASAATGYRPARLGSVSDHREAVGPRTTTITDPEDVDVCDSPPDCPIDIRAVHRRRFTTAVGRKMLAFSVDAYQLFGGLVLIANIKLRLDTRAGPRSDAHIFMALTELWASIGWACGRHYEAGGVTHRYPIKERGDRLTCFIPRRDLRPTKRIRFQALSRGDDFLIDRAPDAGWGGG